MDKIIFIQRVCLFTPHFTTTAVKLENENQEQQEQQNAYRTPNYFLPITFASVCSSWREAMIEFRTAALIWKKMHEAEENQQQQIFKPDHDSYKFEINFHYNNRAVFGSDYDESYEYDDEDENESEDEKERKQKERDQELKIKKQLPNRLIARFILYFEYQAKILFAKHVRSLEIQKLAEKNNIYFVKNNNNNKNDQAVKLPLIPDFSWCVDQLLTIGGRAQGFSDISFVLLCCASGNLEVLKVLLKIRDHQQKDDENRHEDENQEDDFYYTSSRNNFYVKESKFLDEMFLTDIDKYGEVISTSYSSENRRTRYHPLFMAIKNRHHHVAAYLIENYAPTLRKTVDWATEFSDCGVTCLNLAICSNRDLALIKLLVKRLGADVNMVTSMSTSSYAFHGQPISPTLACFHPTTDISLHRYEKVDIDEDDSSDNNDKTLLPPPSRRVRHSCVSYVHSAILHYPVELVCEPIDIFEFLVLERGAHPEGASPWLDEMKPSEVISSPVFKFFVDYSQTQRRRSTTTTTTTTQESDSSSYVLRSRTPFLYFCSDRAMPSSRLLHLSAGNDEEAVYELDKETYRRLMKIPKLNPLAVWNRNSDVANGLLLAILSDRVGLVEAMFEVYEEQKKHEGDDEETKNKTMMKNVDIHFVDFKGDNARSYSVLSNKKRICAAVNKYVPKK